MTRRLWLADGAFGRLDQVRMSVVVGLGSRRHGLDVATRLLLIAAAAVMLATMASASATGRAGRFYTGPAGQVGPLRIDVSRVNDVSTVMGKPDAAEVTNFDASPQTPNSIALGYSCVSHPTVDSMPIGSSNCQTVFYINQDTGELAAFFSSSSEFVGPGQVSPGQPADQVERRLHRHAEDGCSPGLSFGSRRTAAEMLVSVDGGRPQGSSAVLAGGRIGALLLESNRDPVGLLFC